MRLLSVFFIVIISLSYEYQGDVLRMIEGFLSHKYDIIELNSEIEGAVAYLSPVSVI